MSAKMGIDPNTVHELQVAGEAISQLFTAAGKEMTSLEVNMWRRVIMQYGPAVAQRFAEFWMAGGGQTKFRSAPTLEDFHRRVDPNYVSAEDAQEKLRAEVMRCGPYSAPQIKDARLKAAVVLLGGWPKVCQDMPDASQEFLARRFAERFAQVWVQAEGRVLRGETMDEPLGSLAGSNPAGLVHSSTTHLAPPAPGAY